MNFRGKRKELVGFVGALGVVIALAGFVGGYMSVRTTIVASFAVWVLGVMLMRVLTVPPDSTR